MRRALVVLAALLTVIVWLPLLSVVVAGTVASSAGCTLHEGFVNPCVIRGTDWGSTLYAMGMMGWFMLVTAPFMLISLVGWPLYAVIRWRQRRRR